MAGSWACTHGSRLGRMQLRAGSAGPPSGTRARRGGPSPVSAKRSKTARMARGDGLVGVEADLAVRSSPQTKPDRQATPQFAARGLVADAAVEAGAQDVQLGLAHRALQPQHQAIVEQRRVIDAIGVADQRVGQPAQVEQAVPVGVVAGEARDLEPEHDPDVAEGDLGGQAREAAALAGRWHRRGRDPRR